MKRENVLSWDEYFMGLAHLSSMRSKDPSTQVGAVIVDDMHRVVSIGYNGLPFGCSDDDFPWNREGNGMLNTKYAFVVHAELNAILNYGGGSLRGARVYTTLFPCNECTKAIIQAGIKEVIYLSDKYADSDSVKASKRMFDLTKVKYRAYEPRKEDIILSL